jgi:acetyl-CoA synthetase
VYWCSADVGWVTGHSYIVYGPLLNGVTSIMWEGAPDYPNKDIWWEICERWGCTVFYTSPTAIRAAIKWGAEHPQKHDLSSIRLLGSVGEPINPKAWLWYWKVIGGGRCPVVDTWWQTETGHIMITPLPGLTDAKPGSATVPFPGIEAAVYDEEGNEIDEGQGYLVLKHPWPGMLRTLYQDDDRFVETYFERYGKETYLVGDAARKDEDGYIWVLGRIDDVVNVSGHRLSTAEIESAVVSFEKVAECAVIGKQDDDTGQAIVAFVTLEGDENEGSDELEQNIREHVAKKIGKFARPKQIIWSADLPKTRSGKIMRRLLRDIAEGNELGDVTTLREPGVMQDLEKKVQGSSNGGDE